MYCTHHIKIGGIYEILFRNRNFFLILIGCGSVPQSRRHSIVPANSEILFAMGYGSSQNMQIAVDKSNHNSRTAMGWKIKQEFESLKSKLISESVNQDYVDTTLNALFGKGSASTPFSFSGIGEATFTVENFSINIP